MVLRAGVARLFQSLEEASMFGQISGKNSLYSIYFNVLISTKHIIFNN